MRLKCLKCELAKELSLDELKEVGEFVANRKLRAVHFLKYLSMDLREVCKDGRNHEYEFEQSFDKEVHQISSDYKNTEKIKNENLGKIEEYERMIKELQEKKVESEKIAIESNDLMLKAKEKLIEMAWIGDPDMWSEVGI